MEDMSLEELMEMMQEDEAQIQAHPCCSNCLYCHMTYGQLECAYEGSGLVCDSEEWEPSRDVCGRWRSDVTGFSQAESFNR